MVIDGIFYLFAPMANRRQAYHTRFPTISGFREAAIPAGGRN
jgi:hypothetical protein